MSSNSWEPTQYDQERNARLDRQNLRSDALHKAILLCGDGPLKTIVKTAHMFHSFLGDGLFASGAETSGLLAQGMDFQPIAVTAPEVYEKGNGHSYFRDLGRNYVGLDDPDARERLEVHASHCEGRGGAYALPRWMAEEVTQYKGYLALLNMQELPPGTESITITMPPQATSCINAPVVTVAGQQGIKTTLLDSSPMHFDGLIFGDLKPDLHARLTQHVISGTAEDNQVRGIRNTPGIHKVSAGVAPWLDTHGFRAMTARHCIGSGIQTIHTSRLLSPTALAMHPRRWAALGAAGVAGDELTLQGLPVTLEPILPTTVDGDEDVIHILRENDLRSFISDVHVRILADGVGKIIYQLWVHFAFTAEFHPTGIAEVHGPALAAPQL